MFLGTYIEKSIEAEITQVSTDCHDPKNNMFLSLALSVGASIIVSGDTKHLIPMHPYKGIDILLPKDFDERIFREAFLGS